MEEEWRPVVGYEGSYAVSNHGRVMTTRHSRAGLIMKVVDSHGYKRIGLRMAGAPQKGFQVHRLVWEAFRGEIPATLQINHLNGNKADNRLENLEVVTPSENKLHAFRYLGLQPNRVTGEDHPRAKLNWAKVDQARNMRAAGNTQHKIAQTLGVDPSTISNLFRERSWKR